MDEPGLDIEHTFDYHVRMDAAPRGRGTGLNPANRFEEIAYEWEESADPAEKPAPRTRFFRDRTRSILVKNDSPDIPFTWSLNPYRGCEHGCVYCLAGDTAILMADGSTRELKALKVGDEVIGTVREGFYRRYKPTRVLAHWSTEKPAYRVILADGTELVASADHRFLTERGWKYVAEVGSERRPHLTVNNKLMGFGAVETNVPCMSVDYRRGYLCGMIRGDAHLAVHRYKRQGRRNGDQYQFRLALVDKPALERTNFYLRTFGIETRPFIFKAAAGAYQEMNAIRTHARASYYRIVELIAWPTFIEGGWARGFLSGLFDAEGSYSDGILRIANTDEAIIRRAGECLRGMGFDAVGEYYAIPGRKPMRYLRVHGGLSEHLRFMRSMDPAIIRKRSIAGKAVKSSAALDVVAVESLGKTLPMWDIATGTEDFIANGVVSHNCYARPYHEYLGLSSGRDFESMIFIKEDAPALLAAELSKPSWEPDWIALGGVTDVYQPVERRLEITRRCLQVLADARHPCGLVTKNHLVTRDVDVLQELARFGCGRVFVSLTTLDPELARKMEPRASAPANRLDAIRALAKAGVPVGVMAAPMILGLNDHEMPKILASAAEAGAASAGYVPLRLPHQLGTLFEDWLVRHYPDRKEKVLHQIRSARGGRLNDPRFGSRMSGEGIFAEHLAQLFQISCRRFGLNQKRAPFSADHFRRPLGAQLRLL